MKLVKFHHWTLECDIEATRKAYVAVTQDMLCDCAWCRNFLAQSSTAYPQEVTQLLAELAVDPAKPVEVNPPSQTRGGDWAYCWWMHFVGRIIEPSTDEQLQHAAVSLEHCCITFTTRRLVVLPPFEKQPLVQVELTKRLPWVLSEPEPSE